MNQTKKQLALSALAAAAAVWTGDARAEVQLADIDGWKVTTDGRINAFISHVQGENRPDGLQSLSWVGFNESNASGQADSSGTLSKTRIRSGYVPTTIAVNTSKQMSDNLKLATRVELGIQIANLNPTEIADPTWMEPRAAYLDLSGNWGSMRAGRDLSLFPRSNLLMNYELGHGYGVGFPCAYEKVFGGACGHVGFGTLWPDFRANISYTTPSIADIVQLSVGLYDPRTVPTQSWFQTPYPRVESELVAEYSWQDGWGIKAWGNGFWQQVGGTTAPVVDPVTMEETQEDFTKQAYAGGGGLLARLGPFKAGVSGYAGQGMDGFVIFTFNPIFISQDPAVDSIDREFRTTQGFLAEATFEFGDTWVMGGFGKAMFDRMDTDYTQETPDVLPLLSEQTGISAGLFHRVGQVVFGLDYFNASYGFYPRLVTNDAGLMEYVDVAQTVHVVNGGVTAEW